MEDEQQMIENFARLTAPDSETRGTPLESKLALLMILSKCLTRKGKSLDINLVLTHQQLIDYFPTMMDDVELDVDINKWKLSRFTKLLYDGVCTISARHIPLSNMVNLLNCLTIDNIEEPKTGKRRKRVEDLLVSNGVDKRYANYITCHSDDTYSVTIPFYRLGDVQFPDVANEMTELMDSIGLPTHYESFITKSKSITDGLDRYKISIRNISIDNASKIVSNITSLLQ